MSASAPDVTAHRVAFRRLGAALGGAAGPAAAFASDWSHLGARGWHIWVLTTLVGMLLGAMTYGVFVTPHERIERPSLGFAGIFSASTGMLAGAFAAFPIGAVVGAPAGLVAGTLGAWVWRHTNHLGEWTRPAVVFLVAASVGLLVAMGLT